MFRIGEFSKLTQVSIRMLRYYDEVGIFQPAEIDTFTHYRLYSADQIPVLSKIKFLRDLGFNVSEIEVMLGQWENDFILDQLEKKRTEIEETLKIEQGKLLKIGLAEKSIQEKTIGVHYNFSIKSVPSYQVISLRRIVRDFYAEGELWMEMAAFAKEHQIPISEQTFTIYHDLDYREKDVDIEICSPIQQVGEDRDGITFRVTEPIPTMAYAMVAGPFENIAGAFLDLAYWLQESEQYHMAGKSRQIVHRGPWNEKSPTDYLTEIQIPLERCI